MVFTLFVHCISCRLIVAVVYELVTHTHVWCRPPRQPIYVLYRTDQLVTRILVELRIRLGGGCNPTTRTISPHNSITNPVIKQWYSYRSRDQYKIKNKNGQTYIRKDVVTPTTLATPCNWIDMNLYQNIYLIEESW